MVVTGMPSTTYGGSGGGRCSLEPLERDVDGDVVGAGDDAREQVDAGEATRPAEHGEAGGRLGRERHRARDRGAARPTVVLAADASAGHGPGRGQHADDERVRRGGGRTG